MTILYLDFNPYPMQSFQKEKYSVAKQCVGDFNKTENKINTMAMSVGISDSDSPATTTAENVTHTTSSTMNTTTSGSAGNRSGKATGKRTGKRPGRKPAKIDERAKLERSRQSAKECRARKKLRYQYLEELVLNREKTVFSLREELEMFKQWCIQLDKGKIPDALIKMLANEDIAIQRRQAAEMRRAAELHNQQLQQQQQQLQLQQLQLQDLPSTSSAGIHHISSNSSSSSSSSSPSPPQVSIHSSHSNFFPHHQPDHQQQQQQQLSPPPPYPGMSSATGVRHGLIRQMAFDEDGMGPHHQSHLPQHHHQQQQQHIPQSHSIAHCQAQTNPQQPIVITAVSTQKPSQGTSPHPILYNKQQLQNQTCVQESDKFVNRESRNRATQSRHMDYVNQHIQQQQQQIKQQQRQQQNLSVFQNDNQMKAVTSRSDNSYINLPVSTSAYLDDISDLISQETTRNPLGQFTTASSSTTNLFSGMSSTHSSNSGSRMRSQSNPVVIGNLNRSLQQQQQQHSFPRNDIQHPIQPRRSASFTNRSYPVLENRDAFLRKRHTTSDASLTNEIKQEVGLFSGIPLAYTSSAISDVDSDSADENPNISRLFQSSSLSSTTPNSYQKRTLSDPDIHQRNKKAKSLDSEMDSIITDSLFALYHEPDDTKLDDLTTVKCMGSTGTLNTQSAASPFGFVPRNTDSPMTTSSGVTSPAPSCHSGHAGSSPAPQGSSFLEGSNTSSTLSSALMDQDLENTPTASTPAKDTFLFSTSIISTPDMCSETGLNATISEPIPELYSFLADLQADNNSANILLSDTYATTHVSSNTNDQFSNTANIDLKQNPNPSRMHFLHPMTDQTQEPVTSASLTSAGVLNVPSIIEELSSEEST